MTQEMWENMSPPGATAVNTLMWTYKMFPEDFYDGQNNIPESGNGIPDILDEIKYELDFILKMQDKQSGGFYLKVKSQSEHDEDGDRTVWQGDGNKCLTNATADCTAVLAFGSVIFKDFDSDYAETLLAAATKGWDYIEENPWNISIDSTSFWWGSFNIILGNTQDMYIGDKVFGLSTEDSEKLSRDALNFILGVNAMRKCYVTGMGEDSISPPGRGDTLRNRRLLSSGKSFI
jgi:hypothetical protein